MNKRHYAYDDCWGFVGKGGKLMKFYLIGWKTGKSASADVVCESNLLMVCVNKSDEEMAKDCFFEFDIIAKEKDSFWLVEETEDGWDWTLLEDKGGTYTHWVDEQMYLGKVRAYEEKKGG